MEAVQKRSSSHLIPLYREFAAGELSRLLGVNVDIDTADALNRLIMRLPMRFLSSLPEGEQDKDGDVTLSMPGVGKFRILNTKAAGVKADLVGEGGRYPRYKFYPSNSMEAEMEVLAVIANDESKSLNEKNKSYEDKMIEKVSKKFPKQMGVVGKGSGSDLDMGEALKTFIRKEVADILNKDTAPAEVVVKETTVVVEPVIEEMPLVDPIVEQVVAPLPAPPVVDIPIMDAKDKGKAKPKKDSAAPKAGKAAPKPPSVDEIVSSESVFDFEFNS